MRRKGGKSCEPDAGPKSPKLTEKQKIRRKKREILGYSTSKAVKAAGRGEAVELLQGSYRPRSLGEREGAVVGK